MKGIKLVLASFSDSFRIINEAKLKKYYFLPGIIGIFLFVVLIFLANLLSFGIMSSLESIFELEKYHALVSILIKILIWVVTVFLYYLVYKSLLLLLLSPILGYVSERVDSHLTGKKYDFTIKDNMRFLMRGAEIGFRSFIKQLVGTCVIMLLSFVFPINLSIPLLIFLLQGYFTGFSFMDYTLERYEFSPKESLEFLKKKRFYSLLCGSIFTLLFFIPFIGIFLAPLVTCVATTKVTLELIERDKFPEVID